MTNEERWNVFICNLRGYVEEHRHFPNKNSSMQNSIKYTRKKIHEGTFEKWKVQQFGEIEGYGGAYRKNTKNFCGSHT